MDGKLFLNVSILAWTRHWFHGQQITLKIFLSCTFSTLSFQQCFKTIQTKAKITWFLGHIFHGFIPFGYGSYELLLFHKTHSLLFPLSPPWGPGWFRSVKVLQEIPERRPGENLHPLSLSPFISLPQPPSLHSSLLVPFTIHLSSFLSLTLTFSCSQTRLYPSRFRTAL